MWPEIDPVSFDFEKTTLTVGTTREHHKRVELRALLVGGGLMTPASLELVSVSEQLQRERVLTLADGHPASVELVYLMARRNDPFKPASALLPEPHEGRRFGVAVPFLDKTGDLEALRARLGDPMPTVTALDGRPLDDTVQALVLRDMRGLGEPPLFWSFCPDGEVLPGTPMPLLPEQAAAWFGHDPAFVVGAASAVYRGMAHLPDVAPHRVAIFAGDVAFRASAPIDLNCTLSGWIAVDPRTGERLAAELIGPVELTVTARALALSHHMSGQGTLAISTRTRLSMEDT